LRKGLVFRVFGCSFEGRTTEKGDWDVRGDSATDEELSAIGVDESLNPHND
jgi:hypothetical protein